MFEERRNTLPRASALVLLMSLIVETASPALQESASVPLSRRTYPPDLAPLTIECIEDLRFGRVVLDPNHGGLVTIDPATGERRTFAGALPAGGLYAPAQFEIHGEPNARFVIHLPDRVSISIDSDGRDQPALVDFTSSPRKIGLIGPGGRATISVGATLKLVRGQGGGTCSASFDVTVYYP